MDSMGNLLLSDFTLAKDIYEIWGAGPANLNEMRSHARLSSYAKGAGELEGALSRLVVAGYLDCQHKSYRPTELLLSSAADQGKIN